MKALEDLLSISATRFKMIEDDYEGGSGWNGGWDAGVLATAARAYADIATAIAIHKHAEAVSDIAHEATDALLREAEAAERVAHNAKARATKLGG